jgi:hypothetical protein
MATFFSGAAATTGTGVQMDSLSTPLGEMADECSHEEYGSRVVKPWWSMAVSGGQWRRTRSAGLAG